MKAVTYERYGPLDSLRLKEIDKPAPGENEVLIRVCAAGLHVGDCFTVKGTPFPVRMETGFLKPKYGVPGYDLAGVVEQAGSGVTHFKPGDEVFGAAHGTCAEYATATESQLALRPASLSFEEAAAIPTSGLAALHALRVAGELKSGQKLLINGAAGGVGTFAVQIGKAMGAEVTGVCGPGSVELVRSLGADHVIDYTREDFTQGSVRYDVILDNVENRSLEEVRRVLTADGTLILNSGSGAKGFAMVVRLVKPLVLSPFSKQNLRRFISSPKRDELVALKELAEAGSLRPVIDRTFPLEETADALSYIDSGHVHGKVVVVVSGTA